MPCRALTAATAHDSRLPADTADARRDARLAILRPRPRRLPVRHFDFDDKPREQLERRFNELKNQLKENRSQDTEMRGHVNRATMDLHRLQLKLKKLQDRQADIDAEINALADWLDNNAA